MNDFESDARKRRRQPSRPECFGILAPTSGSKIFLSWRAYGSLGVGDTTEWRIEATTMTVTEAPDLLIRVLGPVEVVSESGVAHLGGPKQRAGLAMLSTRSGLVVTTDELVEGMWDDKSPTAVSSSIHSHVSRLRAAIDQRIEHRGSGYLLVADGCVTHVPGIPGHNPP